MDRPELASEARSTIREAYELATRLSRLTIELESSGIALELALLASARASLEVSTSSLRELARALEAPADA